MTFPTLKIPQAVDVLEDSLERMIFSGIIRPDANLPSERKLAEELGVSRTTLREGLSRLRTKGLLRMEARGHRMSDIIHLMLTTSLKSVERKQGAAILDLLEHVTLALLAIAKSKATHQDRAALMQAGTILQSRLQAEGKQDLFDAFYEFILCVAEASHNFLGIQVTHVFLIGFQSYFEAGLGLCGDDFSQNKAISKLILKAGQLDEAGLKGIFALLRGACTGAGINPEFRQPLNRPVTPPQEVAFEKLKELLVAKTFAIGELLPSIDELATTLGLSENALKLAFQQLETHGFVALEKRNRARVLSVAKPEPIESLIEAILRHSLAVEAVFEFRIILEELSVELAATHISTAEEADLKKLMVEMQASVLDQPARYTSLDIALHKGLAAAAQNQPLATMLASFWVIIERVTSFWLAEHAELKGGNNTIHEQHMRIVEKVLAHDGPGAKQAMRKHLDYVLLALREIDQRNTYKYVANTRKLLRG